MASRKKGWSAKVTKTRVHHTSPGLFTQSSATKIADSLLAESRDSAHAVKRITFEINRAGRNLTKTRRTLLERAKQILMHGAATPARTVHSRRAAARNDAPRRPRRSKTPGARSRSAAERTEDDALLEHLNPTLYDAVLRARKGRRSDVLALKKLVAAENVRVRAEIARLNAIMRGQVPRAPTRRRAVSRKAR